ncbi:MAG: IPExxxVDY family protein [Bacteroidota bacterium]
MSKKLQTEVDCFEEYKMIAIVSHLKDYTLCYHINLRFDFDFIKYDDMDGITPHDDVRRFSWYYYKDDISRTVFYLMGNKCESGYLLQSQKTVDYFLLIKNPVSDDLVKSIATNMRQVTNISAVFEIDLQKQKNIDSLLETIELHELEVLNK